MLLSFEIPVESLSADIDRRHWTLFYFKIIDLRLEGTSFDDIIFFLFKLFWKPILMVFLLLFIPVVLWGIFSKFLHFVSSTDYGRVLLNFWFKFKISILRFCRLLFWYLPIKFQNFKFKLKFTSKFLSNFKMSAILTINYHHLKNVLRFVRRGWFSSVSIKNS